MTSKKNSLKIFIWSPMLSNVGTNTAMEGIAESLRRYSNSEVYYLDILGEFSNTNNIDDYYIRFLKLNHLVPNTGKLSKFIIFFFSILSIPFLIKNIIVKKPDVIITGLVGFIPCMMKIFFSKVKVVNSIQGYPKFNFWRKIIWKFLYNKSDYLITMTNRTKKLVEEKILINSKKIFVIENPIISRKIRTLSKNKINNNEESLIFEKDVFCAIGRLTHQKNFLELLQFIKEFNNYSENFNLIIIGEGEQKKILKKYIEKYKLKNCFLLGYKKNPYKYLAKSSLYISTSRWEEPGHTLLEAGYLNIPILSSNCPNGPDEIIQNKINGFKYKLGNMDDFISKLKLYKETSIKEKKRLSLNMKKKVLNYTQLRFYNNFSKIIN